MTRDNLGYETYIKSHLKYLIIDLIIVTAWSWCSVRHGCESEQRECVIGIDSNECNNRLIQGQFRCIGPFILKKFKSKNDTMRK